MLLSFSYGAYEIGKMKGKKTNLGKKFLETLLSTSKGPGGPVLSNLQIILIFCSAEE